MASNSTSPAACQILALAIGDCYEGDDLDDLALGDQEWFDNHVGREFRVRSIVPGDEKTMGSPAAVEIDGPFTLDGHVVIRNIVGFGRLRTRCDVLSDDDLETDAGCRAVWRRAVAETSELAEAVVEDFKKFTPSDENAVALAEERRWRRNAKRAMQQGGGR